MAPPDDDWLKVNSDGAVSKGGDKGGAGAVIRDHDGAFRDGLCHFIRGTADPQSMEILACKRALQVAQEINAERVHVELDSQCVVRMLNNPHKEMSSARPWIQQLKVTLASFSEFRVSWIHRSANVAAHRFARVGIGDELCKVWLGVTLDFVLDVISDEIPNAYD
ncbi:uncharacterized protein [Aegilops tauschii subsp. strangulata]|uniref:uncharacterized protein n=1 Tax=Aegilops tauschii subsp. strangulata TaxID=200361 RepID=UPI00098BC9F8|nr:uncharacterized protein LOC109733301 [Aegilops tauschii subsp. strangulata]